MLLTRFLLLVAGMTIATGCMTTTRVSDSREPEIQITASGEILFEDQTIAKDEIPAIFKARAIRRDETIFILVPSEVRDRNLALMKAIVSTLKQAGYGRTVFTTHRKAVSNLK